MVGDLLMPGPLETGVSGVEPHWTVRTGHRKASPFRQFFLQWVHDSQGADGIMAGQRPKQGTCLWRDTQEVTDHENPAASVRHPASLGQCRVQPGLSRLLVLCGCVIIPLLLLRQGVQQPKHRLLAAGRPKYAQGLAIENNAAHLVPGPQGEPGQDRGDLGTANLFEGAGAGKKQTGAEIAQEQHGALPFFLVKLGVWFLAPGGYPPVNTADVVAWLVQPDFRKGHSPAALGRTLQTGLAGTHWSGRGQFQRPGICLQADKVR